MSCCDSGDYDGTLTLIKVRAATAKKHHTCCECRRTIAPGDVYIRTVCAWKVNQSKYFNEVKQCHVCAAILECYGEYCAYGELREIIGEHWNSSQSIKEFIEIFGSLETWNMVRKHFNLWKVCSDCRESLEEEEEEEEDVSVAIKLCKECELDILLPGL